jgi:hypothetical protein
MRDVPLVGAVVDRQRTDERVRRRLLHDVRGPAGDPAGDEERREGRRVPAHEVVDGRRRVIEVRLDALALAHHRLECDVELEEVGAVVVLDHALEGIAHRRHAGVAVLVDAVAEAHDLAPVRERVVEPGGGAFGAALAHADLVERVHDGLVGAAVQGPLQGADGPDDRGVQVGQGRRDHPRGERGGVERVLGVEDHRHVERRDDLELGRLAEGLPQEVGRVAEVVARFDELELVTAALVVGDDRGQRGEQPDGLVEARLARVVERVRVGRADDAHGGAHDVHRVRGERQLVDDALDLVVEAAVRPLALLELGELAVVGKLAEPEQVGDLFEGDGCRELLHRVAAVQQRVGLGVDLRDGRVVDRHAGQALVDLSLFQVRPLHRRAASA